jgi:hypothetical protein
MAYGALVVMHIRHSYNRITEEECGSITVYCTAADIIVEYGDEIAEFAGKGP